MLLKPQITYTYIKKKNLKDAHQHVNTDSLWVTDLHVILLLSLTFSPLIFL